MPANAVAIGDRRGIVRSFIPLLILAVAAVLANAGVSMTRDAHGATSNVTVTATVAPITSTVSNGCSGAIAFTVTQNNYSSGSCALTFGSSNASNITLSVQDSTVGDAFFASNFADATADCAPMASSDQVGYKILSGANTTATVNKCSASASGNTQISDIPNNVPIGTSADVACTTSAIGSQKCEFEVGTFEAGSNAPAGAYTGTIVFTSS
jgi:hypothetical protein